MELTDGAGDKEARMGVVEKRRGGVIVKPRDADYSRVLLPRCHAPLLTLLLRILINTSPTNLRLCLIPALLFFFLHFSYSVSLEPKHPTGQTKSLLLIIRFSGLTRFCHGI